MTHHSCIQRDLSPLFGIKEDVEYAPFGIGKGVNSLSWIEVCSFMVNVVSPLADVSILCYKESSSLLPSTTSSISNSNLRLLETSPTIYLSQVITMSTRSSRRIGGLGPATPPKPPPPPAPVQRNITYSDGRLPPSLLNKTVHSCFVEVLDYGEVNLLEDDDSDYEHKIKNHVIVRLLFRRKIEEGTSDAPSGTVGVRLSFDLVGSAPGAGPNEMGGQFRASTITYDDASISAVKVFRLRLRRENLALRHFVRPPIAQRMTDFFFAFDGRGYMGCRDWM